MDHSLPLITTLVGGLVLAYLFGMLASRLRISPMVGYLAAGVVCGPFTPGYVADLRLAPELAEIGVILLMFGVGLHFSVKDLLSVKHIGMKQPLCYWNAPGIILRQKAKAFCTAAGKILTWRLRDS